MNRGALLLTILVVSGLVYGSLFPFSFHTPPGEVGALGFLLSTWHQLPPSKGNALANLLLYAPFGFLAARTLSGRFSWPAAFFVACICGAALSISMELLQFYDAGRDTSMSDVYLNTTGTLLGAVANRALGRQLVAVARLPNGASWFALFVLVAWLGWRLFPYEPVIDLHKYWASLKPVVLTPSFRPYDVFRYAMMWTAVAFLARYGLKLHLPRLAIPIAMLGVFVAKVFIVDQTITLPEIAGAIMAIVYLEFVLEPYVRAGTKVLAALFLLSVVQERLLPFDMSGPGKPFEWIPFFGFLHGSLAVNVQSFMQKCFLYGAGVYLLVKAGLGLSVVAILESLILLTTSVLETDLAGRSGEITDALMALLLALAYLLLEGRASDRKSADVAHLQISQPRR